MKVIFGIQCYSTQEIQQEKGMKRKESVSRFIHRNKLHKVRIRQGKQYFYPVNIVRNALLPGAKGE